MKRFHMLLLVTLVVGFAIICFNLRSGMLSNPFTILESLTNDTENDSLFEGGFGYTNTCPSSYELSQPQAVDCGGFHIYPGCCDGAGGCNYRPCEGGRFKCGFAWCYNHYYPN